MGRLKRIVTYTSGAVVGCGLVVMFILDSYYGNSPNAPDIESGRIFERTIKYHGQVYLTWSEYWPYQWIMIAIVIAAVAMVAIYLIDFLVRPGRFSR